MTSEYFKIREKEVIISDEDKEQVKTCFQDLLGVNGDIYYKIIVATGMLSTFEYNTIAKSILHNNKESLTKHFGLVKYYHNKFLLSELKKKKIT